MEIWIVAGQSNAVGENSQDEQKLPDLGSPWPSQILSFSAQHSAWEDAQPNIHYDPRPGPFEYFFADSVGPDMAFACTLLQMHQPDGSSGRQRTIGLIPTAKGATNLVKDWRTPDGLFYTHMLERVRAGLAAAGVQATTHTSPTAASAVSASGTEEQPRLAGMLWVQGESDAEEGLESAAQAYGANFEAFTTAVRQEFAAYHPCLPIVMGLMSDVGRGDHFPYIAQVRAQQLNLTLPALVKVDMLGYEMFPQFGGSLVHVTKAGQCALGAAMANAYAVWAAAHPADR